MKNTRSDEPRAIVISRRWVGRRPPGLVVARQAVRRNSIRVFTTNTLTLNLNRLTDQIDPNVIHNEDTQLDLLTVNSTVLIPASAYGKFIPQFWTDFDMIPANCQELNQAFPDAIGPFFTHEAQTWEPTTEISTYTDFENIAKHPENARICIAYDTIPDPIGSVWEHFPPKSQWDALAPKDSVRNMVGREVAVAYREHGGQPYHFTVMSYDERGRVEALLRYTENLGFDAVYYEYNSLNELISITTTDPFRLHKTWYGYDDNGRVDSVWTKVGTPPDGLGGGDGGLVSDFTLKTWEYNSTELVQPEDAHITYDYTKRGSVDKMYYPLIGVETLYEYTPRQWLETLTATNGQVDLFRQELTYDDAGNITDQWSQHDGQAPLVQEYENDNIGQLTKWTTDPAGTGAFEEYVYDNVGNRTELKQGDNQTPAWTAVQNTIGWHPGNYFAGPNQLTIAQSMFGGQPNGSTEYEYDADGALETRTWLDLFGNTTMEEEFEYSSWRGLSWKYTRTDPNMPQGAPNEWEWRYRYNAISELESAQQTQNPLLPNHLSRSLRYNLLGGEKETRAIWRGSNNDNGLACSGSTQGGSLFWIRQYPVYGVAYTGVLEDIPHVSSSPGGDVYSVSDHMGSTRVLYDQLQGVSRVLDYAPFGNCVNCNDNVDFQFNGRPPDVLAGSSRHGVRSLLHSSGTFSSVDPLWEEFASWTPYQYSYNSPLTYVDPDGHQGRRVQMVQADLTMFGPEGTGGGAAGSAGAARSAANALRYLWNRAFPSTSTKTAPPARSVPRSASAPGSSGTTSGGGRRSASESSTGPGSGTRGGSGKSKNKVDGPSSASSKSATTILRNPVSGRVTKVVLHNWPRPGMAVRIDLNAAGRAHNGVPTPHMQIMRLHVNTNNGRFSWKLTGETVGISPETGRQLQRILGLLWH